MDHSNDPPPIDARRLARWTAPPPKRRDRRCSDLASPRTVIEAHGGEVTFWLAWLRGELDDDLQAWFRQQAEKDAELRQDLRSIEQPHGAGYSTRSARAELRNALEAVNYLTENHGGVAAARPALLAFEEVQTETDLAMAVQSSGRKVAPAREANQAELRRRIRSIQRDASSQRSMKINSETASEVGSIAKRSGRRSTDRRAVAASSAGSLGWTR